MLRPVECPGGVTTLQQQQQQQKMSYNPYIILPESVVEHVEQARNNTGCATKSEWFRRAIYNQIERDVDGFDRGDI